MKKLNVGGMQITINAILSAATAKEEDRLDHQATTCRDAGDWEGGHRRAAPAQGSCRRSLGK